MKPLKDRFYAKVTATNSCWLWKGQLDGHGYGRIKHKRRPLRAHRVSWELHNGPIPDGMFVCHHCDNPRCVRPDHLFLGTHNDNMADMVRKQRHPGWNGGRKGERNPRAKLTKRDVDAIRRLYKEGRLSQTRIASQFSISRFHASRIVLGTYWPEDAD